MHSLAVLLILLTTSGAWAAKDSCFECHSVQEGMSIVYKDDIHYQYGISCADCHGGDPKEDEGNVAMNASRGFKVRVTREDTPEYCGRCHSASSAGGKAVAAMARKISGLAPADRRASAREAAHALRLAP